MNSQLSPGWCQSFVSDGISCWGAVSEMIRSMHGLQLAITSQWESCNSWLMPPDWWSPKICSELLEICRVNVILKFKATSLCDQSVEVDSQTAASWCSAASAANGLPPLDQHQSHGNGSGCFPLCHVFFHILNRLNRLMVKTIWLKRHADRCCQLLFLECLLFGYRVLCPQSSTVCLRF